MIQNTISKLAELIGEFKLPKQRKFALNLLNKLTDEINRQNVIIEKSRNGYDEVNKYVMLLLLHGYDENKIKLLPIELITWLLKNNKGLKEINQERITNTKRPFIYFLQEYDREPENIDEFKSFIDAQSS